jgi:hypothetical protein
MSFHNFFFLSSTVGMLVGVFGADAAADPAPRNRRAMAASCSGRRWSAKKATSRKRMIRSRGKVACPSGASWVAQKIASAADFTGVSSSWGGQLVLATDSSGAIWESDDSANSFHVAFQSGASLEAVAFGPGGHALAVGAKGAAFARAPNGSWSSVATGAAYDLHAVLVTGKSGYGSSGRAYAAGDHGTLMASDDFGAHWNSVSLDGATNALYSLDDL